MIFVSDKQLKKQLKNKMIKSSFGEPVLLSYQCFLYVFILNYLFKIVNNNLEICLIF
jgi:hypothetical protein